MLVFYTRAKSNDNGGGGGGGNNPVQPPDIPYGPIYQDPDSSRDRLHALARSDLCVSVLGDVRAGAGVGV